MTVMSVQMDDLCCGGVQPESLMALPDQVTYSLSDHHMLYTGQAVSYKCVEMHEQTQPPPPQGSCYDALNSVLMTDRSEQDLNDLVGTKREMEPSLIFDFNLSEKNLALIVEWSFGLL